MSMQRIEVNPLDSRDAFTGVSLNMDSLSGARLINQDELQAFLKSLNSKESNEDRLQYLQDEKMPYLFSSAALLQIVNVTPSVKTRLAIIAMLAPRLTDPKAKYEEFVGMFRYSEEKAKCEEALKARSHVLNASLFNSNSRGLGLTRPSIGGTGGTGSRGGKRMSSIPEPGKFALRRAVTLPVDAGEAVKTVPKEAAAKAIPTSEEGSGGVNAAAVAAAADASSSVAPSVVRAHSDGIVQELLRGGDPSPRINPTSGDISPVLNSTSGDGGGDGGTTTTPPRNRLLSLAPREKVNMTDKNKVLHQQHAIRKVAAIVFGSGTNGATNSGTNGGTKSLPTSRAVSPVPIGNTASDAPVKAKPLPAFLKRETSQQQTQSRSASEKPIIDENGVRLFVPASEAEARRSNSSIASANANSYLNGLKNGVNSASSVNSPNNSRKSSSSQSSSAAATALASSRIGRSSTKPCSFSDVLIHLKSTWETTSEEPMEQSSEESSKTDNGGIGAAADNTTTSSSTDIGNMSITSTTVVASSPIVSTRQRILSSLELVDQNGLDLIVDSNETSWLKKAELFKSVVAGRDAAIISELEKGLSGLGLSVEDAVEIASRPDRWVDKQDSGGYRLSSYSTDRGEGEGGGGGDTSDTASDCSLDIHAATNCSPPPSVGKPPRRSLSLGHVLLQETTNQPQLASSRSEAAAMRPEHRYMRSVGSVPLSSAGSGSLSPSSSSGSTGERPKRTFHRSPSWSAVSWGGSGWGGGGVVVGTSSSSSIESQNREKETSMYVQLVEEGPVGVDDDGKPLYSYKELVRKNVCKSYGDIKQTELEQHMTDSDFLTNFGMPKVDFNKLPSWRRIQQKKQLLLF